MLTKMSSKYNKYFMCNFSDLVKEEEISNDHVKHLWSCQWDKVYLNKIIDKWKNLSKVDLSNEEKSKELFTLAIGAILIFIQNNFTGPFEQLKDFNDLLEKSDLEDCNPFEKLMENGEELNPNVQLGQLLIFAKDFLKNLLEQEPSDIFLNWWKLRLICVHQHIIDDLTENLYKQLQDTIKILLEKANAVEDKELESLLRLEIASSWLQYHRTQKAENVLQDLCENLQVSLDVEGLLGVRTKFQQKPLPQLCLKVNQNDPELLPGSKATNGGHSIPKLLLLEDDTRLERIRFIEPKDNEVMSLPSILQALVLAKVKLLRRSQPKDRLGDEELEPYINTLLYQEHGPLQVRQSCLLFNCVQESTQRRTVERSWKQCEEAVKLLSDTTYSLQQRLSYAFAGFLQPKWQVQMQLCEILLSLGMTKTALDIYLEIQAWEQVITCYTRLELRHKAAEIIRQELAKKPTALLHCLLGDATDDPKCYETAWEFSKHTSGKAQAHWGNYFFGKAEYKEAVEHFEKALEINSLQERILLRLGYSGLMLENWELAVHAYIRYTHLEPACFEAWNNLAKALVKAGDKKRAHKILSESLKCNYTNWKVWENFMVVSLDTSHFEDALNAYNRLSELKDRFLDLEVLCLLTHAIVNGKQDAKGQTQERLLKKAITLLGGQCIKHANEPKVWELASILAITPLAKAQKLVKAVSAFTRQDTLWPTKQPLALKALQLTREACERSLEAIKDHSKDESEAMITSQLYSARLAAQGTLRALEKETQQFPENESELQEVKSLLEKVTEELKERNASR